MVWRVTHAQYKSEQLKALLENHWEPFSAEGLTIWLRKEVLDEEDKELIKDFDKSFGM